MGFLLVVKAEIVRRFIIMRRYWFATITGILVGYGTLLALIIGFMTNRDEVTEEIERRFSGVDPTAGTNLALGFILGLFAFGIVGLFTQGLQGMARTGQLEQLCLSPHGLVSNFLARSLVGAVSTIASSAVVLFLIAETLQGQLHAAPIPTLVLLALTYVNLIGFGFMVGGLVLLFKQTGQVAVLLRTGLLFLAIWVKDEIDTGYPVLDWLVHILPVTDAAICLKHVLIRNQMVGDEFVSVFKLPSFGFFIVNAIVWTVVGISVFKAMENWSRDKGTLGAY